MHSVYKKPRAKTKDFTICIRSRKKIKLKLKLRKIGENFKKMNSRLIDKTNFYKTNFFFLDIINTLRIKLFFSHKNKAKKKHKRWVIAEETKTKTNHNAVSHCHHHHHHRWSKCQSKSFQSMSEVCFDCFDRLSSFCDFYKFFL